MYPEVGGDVSEVGDGGGEGATFLRQHSHRAGGERDRGYGSAGT